MAYTGFITISTDAPNISGQAVTGEGANVLSNPKLLDDRARFNLIDESPGILRLDMLDNSTSTDWNCICPRGQNGAPLYVRVGEGGAIQTSPTGEEGTWVDRTSGTPNTLNYVIYDGTRFLAVGNSGTLCYSDDGITWGTFGMTPADLNCIAYSGSLYVIAGNAGGTLYTSGDPTSAASWAPATGGQTDSRNFRSVVFDDALGGPVAWLVGENAIIFSATGTDYQIAYQIADYDYMSIIRVASGVMVASGGTGAIVRTTDGGINWTLVSSDTSESLRLFTANGYVYAVGSNGASLESTDNGATWHPAPSAGVSFLRFGAHDPYNPTRAIIVGDSGVTLAGQYPFHIICYGSYADRANGGPELGIVQEVYVDLPKRVIVPNLLEIDVAYFTP